MSAHPLRLASYGLLAISLGWLALGAPGPFLRECQFLAEVLVVTWATRTVSAATAISALGWGVGMAVPATILLGRGLSAAGFDAADAPMDWALVPAVEEVIKLVPVAFLLARRWRSLRLGFNLSDWLLLGCAAGAGFAMAENALLVRNSPRVLHDMAIQFGPGVAGVYLVPGAWGTAGYVGHAAATGFVASGVGLTLWLRHRGRAGSSARMPWQIPAIAAFGWITVEHMLSNLHVDSGSDLTFLMGNARLTPWMLVAVTIAIVTIDWSQARAVLARSPRFRKRVGLLRKALTSTSPPPRSRRAVAMLLSSELRLVNAAAWMTTPAPPAPPKGSP